MRMQLISSGIVFLVFPLHLYSKEVSVAIEATPQLKSNFFKNFEYVLVVDPQGHLPPPKTSFLDQIATKERLIISIETKKRFDLRVPLPRGTIFLMAASISDKQYKILGRYEFVDDGEPLHIKILENECTIKLRIADPTQGTILDSKAFRERVIGGYVEFSAYEGNGAAFNGGITDLKSDDGRITIDAKVRWVGTGSFNCKIFLRFKDESGERNFESMEIDSVVALDSTSLESGNPMAGEQRIIRIIYENTPD